MIGINKLSILLEIAKEESIEDRNIIKTMIGLLNSKNYQDSKQK